MAVTHAPAGYTGTVDQVDEARRFALASNARFRVSTSTDWAATADGVTARQVNIAAGLASACGVADITTATDSVVVAVNGGGTDRYDAIVASFDWAAGTVTFRVVQGTTVPPTIVKTGTTVDTTKINWLPGTRYDAVIAIVRVRPSVTTIAPADLYDCRWYGTWSTVLLASASLWRDYIDVDFSAAETYYDAESGGGAVTTAVTAPSNAANVTVPAGTWDIDFRAYFSISISSARSFVCYVYANGVQVASATYSQGVASTVLSQEATGFARIVTTGSTVLQIRTVATAIGGTQNNSANALRARRVI